MCFPSRFCSWDGQSMPFSARQNGIHQQRVGRSSSLCHWIKERIKFQNMCMKVTINIFAVICSNVFKMHLISAPTVLQVICEFSVWMCIQKLNLIILKSVSFHRMSLTSHFWKHWLLLIKSGTFLSDRQGMLFAMLEMGQLWYRETAAPLQINSGAKYRNEES